LRERRVTARQIEVENVTRTPTAGFARAYGMGSNQPQGQLPGRTGVAGDEVADMLGNTNALDIAPSLNFEGDIF